MNETDRSWIAAARERAAGIVRCSTTNAVGLPLAGFLSMFGLEPHEDRLLKVNAARAERLLALLLSRRFVSGAEAISISRAQQLAAAFVADVGGELAAFYTNGPWDLEAASHSWTPLTNAVFDGGIVACGPSSAACLWIEEDD